MPRDTSPPLILPWRLTSVEQSRGLASLKFNPLSNLFAGITAILGTSVAKKHLCWLLDSRWNIFDPYFFVNVYAFYGMHMMFKRRTKYSKCNRYFIWRRFLFVYFIIAFHKNFILNMLWKRGPIMRRCYIFDQQFI